MESGLVSEFIESQGGIFALLDSWAKCRAFPWHPDGFMQRAERREFRFAGVRWPELDEDETSEFAIQAHRAEYFAAQTLFDSECARYCKIVDADDRDKFDHLTHGEFCDTAYWIGLANWVKQESGMRCFDCHRRFSSTSDLDAHHKTYRHRGHEWPDHLADLAVLCRQCHLRRHGR